MIAAEGSETGFYTGRVAESIVEAVKNAGIVIVKKYWLML